MFLEYEHRIKTITNEKDEELKNLKIEKKKTEEDYRSAIKEKHLLKDTERILLNTFDTLKQYYDAKERKAEAETRPNKRNSRHEGEKSTNETNFKFFECKFETNKKESLMKHVVDDHDSARNRKCPEGQQQNKSRQSETSKTTRTKYYTRDERMNNGYCVHWNNGHCGFGDFCRYLHVESPYCYFQDTCQRRDTCRYFHESQRFLAQRSSPWQTR